MNIYTYKTFIHPLAPVLNPTGLASFHCFTAADGLTVFVLLRDTRLSLF